MIVCIDTNVLPGMFGRAAPWLPLRNGLLDYNITEDQHFAVMRGSGYQPQPVTPEEFIRRHLSGGSGS